MIPVRAVFAFFPYLITRERVTIRGIEFRSNQDIADLPADVQEHLTTLSQMFFLEDGVRIEQMVCAYIELPNDKDEQEDALRRLHEARLLVGYLYKRLLSVNHEVYELRDQTYDLMDPDVVAVKSIIGAVKLALQAYKEACPTITKPLEEAIDKILSESGQPSSALPTRIEECAGQLRSGRVMTDRSPNARLTDIIIALLEYTSKPSFKVQCYFGERQTPSGSGTQS